MPTDGRVFMALMATCHFCNRAATWVVWEHPYSQEHMEVCDEHKYTAYS